ncbi:ABC transporter substrate-binding protein [Amaricoccus sp.]|uniref:ABC transporter substrate-binding protein n=1 Tax=Amaricoccus sp. TaxID=1872485 RepID=UPI00262E2D39|nr:ABC transporter substrate-binding protein [Amaricoccus sp.]HRO10597.1 ABC transporter substrate-binding protein [Amaricoccus sp.]
MRTATGWGTKGALALGAAVATLWASAAGAVNINIVSGAVGADIAAYRELVKPWEAQTGNTVTFVPMPSSTTDQFAQYKLWLAAGNADIDVYLVDVIWAPQLSDQFLDLTEAASAVTPDHFPSIIESQTVNGKLVAMPFFTDAPALYYRKDLLEKHGAEVPKTWDELTATAQKVMEAERAEGSGDLWGYVWQGAAYEGLTCNALEWIKSNGGGQIIEADGTISVNNENAVAALEMAKGWVGTISPPGVLSYTEEESRGVWQTGNSVFMRNWPYAYALGNAADSPITGKFDVAPLPSGGGDNTSAATLGGWNIAVSRYSPNPEAATELVMFMTSTESQKAMALQLSHLPTIISLYDDADIAAQQSLIPRWKDIFLNAVPRPSAPTKVSYNEVSSKFWTAVHDTLSGTGTAAENLEILELDLDELKGGGW